MSACEKCWTDAFWISRTRGPSQVEAYKELLEMRDREGHPCTPEQQHGGWMDPASGVPQEGEEVCDEQSSSADVPSGADT